MTRMPPLPPGRWPHDMRSALKAMMPPQTADTSSPTEKRPSGANILGVLAHHPTLAHAWFTLNNHILRATTLSDRHREVVMMRVASVWQSTYQWSQHLPMARDAGLTDLEIADIAWGASSPHWDDEESALIEAVDDLIEHGEISQDTWRVLRNEFTDEQILDLIVTIGTFTTTAWMVRSLDIELDDDLRDYTTSMVRRAHPGT